MVLIAVFAGLIWLRAAEETADATAAGRRIIIRLSDGSFEMVLPTSLPPENPGETPPAQPPSETPAASNSPTGEATATATVATETAKASAESPATATAPAALAEAPPPEAPMPTNTAAIPLNPVKDALREKLSIGTLPIIAKDGTKPWEYYAKPYKPGSNNHLVAIVITGLGQSKNATLAAIKLPENITLSFSPYPKDAGTWSNSARASGHEVMLDMPLEPSNYPATDPGPHGLFAGKSSDKNAANLQWLMARTQGYIGFAAASNEVYSQNDDNFKNTLELLNLRGLMLVLPHAPARKETSQIITASKLPTTTADIMLDEELTPEGIQTRLSALEKTATRRGYAVAYTHAVPLVIQQLAAWSEKLETRGYSLAPVSYVAQQQPKP